MCTKKSPIIVEINLQCGIANISTIIGDFLVAMLAYLAKSTSTVQLQPHTVSQAQQTVQHKIWSSGQQYCQRTHCWNFCYLRLYYFKDNKWGTCSNNIATRVCTWVECGGWRVVCLVCTPWKIKVHFTRRARPYCSIALYLTLHTLHLIDKR